MTRVGLQIPNFTYPSSDQPLFEQVAAIAVAGEEAGFDTIFVMDHFFQLPLIGAPSWRCSRRTRCSERSRPGRKRLASARW